jgi:hypothetical protein
MAAFGSRSRDGPRWRHGDTSSTGFELAMKVVDFDSNARTHLLCLYRLTACLAKRPRVAVAASVPTPRNNVVALAGRREA